jgi:tetratricopeptide (TPR) repeat protein
MNTLDLRQLFGAGAQLFQQRRFEEAARVFRHAAELAPGSAPVWCNLAAAYIELRQPEQALAAADRAIAIAPEFAPAHANRGDALRLAKRDLTLCRDAYRRAVELQPRSPDLLNKQATTLQALGELDAAGEAYARALALAPDYWLARLNYGCLLILQGETQRAREIALQGAALAGGDEIRRREFGDAVKIIDRNAALQPLLAEALARSSPLAFVTNPLARARGAPVHDATLAACVAGCLARASGDAQGHSRIDGPPDELSDMLEAHFSAHLGEDAADVRATMAFLCEHGARGRDALPAMTDAKLRDAHNYYAAIRHHREVCGAAECDADNVAAWLRYWHAFLGSHRREIAPGQLKAFPNSLIVNPDVARTAPGLVEGTLAHVYANAYPALARGAARAALVYYVIADVHPFADGNGRLGRFLMNRELAAAGLAPVVTPRTYKPPFTGVLAAIRRDHDLGPFVAWLASCDAWTRGMRKEISGL